MFYLLSAAEPPNDNLRLRCGELRRRKLPGGTHTHAHILIYNTDTEREHKHTGRYTNMDMDAHKTQHAFPIGPAHVVGGAKMCSQY